MLLICKYLSISQLRNSQVCILSVRGTEGLHVYALPQLCRICRGSVQHWQAALCVQPPRGWPFAPLRVMLQCLPTCFIRSRSASGLREYCAKRPAAAEGSSCTAAMLVNALEYCFCTAWRTLHRGTAARSVGMALDGV